jgi:hypothetical protein
MFHLPGRCRIGSNAECGPVRSLAPTVTHIVIINKQEMAGEVPLGIAHLVELGIGDVRFIVL